MHRVSYEGPINPTQPIINFNILPVLSMQSYLIGRLFHQHELSPIKETKMEFLFFSRDTKTG